MPCLRNLQPPQYASCTNAAVDNPENTLALMTVCCQGHLLLMTWLLPYPTPTPPPQVWFCNWYWEGLMNKTGMLHASFAWVTSVTLTAPSKFTAPRLSPTIGHRQPTGPSAPFPGSPASKKACQESDQSLRDLQDDYRTAVQHSLPISSSKEKTHSSEAVAEEKDYICFFTCATTRVVRLVVVTDFSIQTFVLA